jgi:uncharacterized protein
VETSRFNSLIEAAPGRYVAFNHARGACADLSPSAFRLLSGDATAAPPADELAELTRQGFLVASRESEREWVAGRLDALRHAGGTVHFSLVLTYACNLRCPYCYEEASCRRSAHMSLDTAERVAEHIQAECREAAATQLGLTLYGGEPFLNLPAAYRIVGRLQTWCRAQGITLHTNLITNGTRLTRAALLPLRASLRTVQLTLDGPREHHDRVRVGADGRGTFDRILASAESVLALGVRVLFRIQVTPDSEPLVGRCLGELAERGLLAREGVGVYVFPILDVGGVCSAKAFRCYAKYFSPEVVRRLERAATGHGVNLFHLPRPVWEQPFCSFVNAHSWIVDPLGEKYKCVSMIGHAEERAGSTAALPADEAAELRARARAFVARSGLTIPECRECECLPTCDGGCAFRAQCSTGDRGAPSCEMHKEALRDQVLAARRLARVAEGRA